MASRLVGRVWQPRRGAAGGGQSPRSDRHPRGPARRQPESTQADALGPHGRGASPALSQHIEALTSDAGLRTPACEGSVWKRPLTPHRNLLR